MDVAKPPASREAERVLSFPEVIEGLGISRAGFYRSVKPHLPIVQLSPRRFGVRESDYREFLDRRSGRSGSP